MTDTRPEKIARFNAFIERVQKLEAEIAELRKPFNWNASQGHDEAMISASFGNIITNLNSIRLHARRLQDFTNGLSAELPAPVNKIAAE